MVDSETNKSNLIICGVCKKSFKTKSYLNVHKRIHSEEKLYKCDVCNKSFTLKGYLTKHMFVHSGKKTFNVKFVENTMLKKVI